MLLEISRARGFRIDGVPQPFRPFRLVNADTDKRIPFAKKANTDTGEWEALAASEDGTRPQVPARIVRGRCPLRIEWLLVAPDYVPPAPPVKPARVLSPREQLDEIRRIGRDYTHGQPIIAVAGIECEAAGCHRLATIETADEQEIDPGLMPTGHLCERAVTTRLHKYCDRCFRNPTFTSVRGVTREVSVGTRPE